MKKCRQPLTICVLAILDGSQQNQGTAGIVCRLWDLSLLCCTIKQMLQCWSAMCYILPLSGIESHTFHDVWTSQSLLPGTAVACRS